MLAFGTSVVLDELPDRVRLATGVSTSSTVKLCGPLAVPAVVVLLVMSEIVGLSLTAVTVKTKVSLVVPPSVSVTVTVMVVVPD
jgi:hypothetical protein